jgi:plasmid maintenance system antidote protein VapI
MPVQPHHAKRLRMQLVALDTVQIIDDMNIAGLRLSKALGRTPESWLAMQYRYDLWRARQHVDLARVGKIRLTAD